MAPAVETATLVLAGRGGSLSFRDGSGAKRRVVPGEPFEVDAATAAILLADPNVSAAGEASARNDAATATVGLTLGQELAALTFPQLQHAVAELGLKAPKGAKKPDLLAMVLEAKRLADAAADGGPAGSGEGSTGGTSGPADDPGATPPGEAGAPPAQPRPGAPSGAIVLGDLPDSAKRQA